jgi:ABC-type Fe3+/spermidine/putrescine transport system ATPase subunit
VRLGDLELPVTGAESTGEATLVIRPETITLAAAPPTEAGRPFLRGRVKTAAFLGGLARYWVQAMDMEWVVDQAAPGERMFTGEVYLALAPERMHVLLDRHRTSQAST